MYVKYDVKILAHDYFWPKITKQNKTKTWLYPHQEGSSSLKLISDNHCRQKHFRLREVSRLLIYDMCEFAKLLDSAALFVAKQMTRIR